MDSLFKNLGVGVGLRPTHHSQFIDGKPESVSWIEVVSENFMPWKGRGFPSAVSTLEKMRRDLPVALHGVSMNLGSADDLDLDYMARLKSLIDRLDPVVVSDHLAWTGIDGFNTHDLLPVPYTEESLQHMARKIEQAQEFLGRRLLIENPSSYFEYQHSEMSEVAFLKELLERADCGLLLDVNNVYVSSINHGFNAESYLSTLPIERVGQIHVAGHSQVDGHLIDTHDSPVSPEVWQLLRFTLERTGPKSVMIERDGNIPEWTELEIEIKKLGGICDETQKLG